MLTQLKAQNRHPYNGSIVRSLTFTMAGNEYVIRGIEGLGPVKSEVVTMDVPTESGRHFMNAKDVQRNIIMTIGFQPNYASGSTISELRRVLYAVLSPSRPVELELTDSVLGVLTISGIVESHEPKIFAQDPEVQISILCQNPYFDGPEGLQTISLTAADTFVVNYPGDIPVGFIFEADVSAVPLTQITLTNRPAGDFGSFTMMMSFAVGDHVTISTIPGDRRAEYIRSAALINAMGYMTGSLTKTKLQPGNNYFQLLGWGKLNNITMKYNRLYGGL